MRAFIRFHGLRQPAALGTAQVGAYLAWLAGSRGILVSTHEQALFALPLVFGKVLGCDLSWMKEIRRPCSHRRLPGLAGRDPKVRPQEAGRCAPAAR